jgi:glycosyltransferase involved in cell wall biosynthesis
VRILQICHRIPYPPIDGGNIVMMNMALALTESGNEVHQFALNTNRHFVDPVTIPADIRKKLNFHSAPIDTRVRAGGLIRNFFTSGSYNTSRFYDTNAEEELIALLGKFSFDIVQLETLFAAPYVDAIRKNTNAKIVLRAHNVEHIIWQRLAEVETKRAKKSLLKFLAARLKKYELAVLNKIDALIPITEVDEQVFRNYNFNKPMLTLPMSMDISEYHFNADASPEMCLFHLGSMDWMPNLEAVEWFLKKCWPGIHAAFPTLRLYVAGRSFPQHIIDAKHRQVICEGRIEDAHSYMAGKQIMIVPLHSGSGMRVKIIQGMALGKTIIATSIGAEGIPAEHETNILIADTPADFIALVKRCIENPQWCRQIGINAREFAEMNYSNKVIGKKLTEFYRLLRQMTS